MTEQSRRARILSRCMSRAAARRVAAYWALVAPATILTYLFTHTPG